MAAAGACDWVDRWLEKHVPNERQALWRPWISAVHGALHHRIEARVELYSPTLFAQGTRLAGTQGVLEQKKMTVWDISTAGKIELLATHNVPEGITSGTLQLVPLEDGELLAVHVTAPSQHPKVRVWNVAQPDQVGGEELLPAGGSLTSPYPEVDVIDAAPAQLIGMCEGKEFVGDQSAKGEPVVAYRVQNCVKVVWARPAGSELPAPPGASADGGC